MRLTSSEVARLRLGVVAHPGRGGQAIVIMAISVVLLAAMLALTVDVGSAFVKRRSLQTAADAGVMAGAHLALEDAIYGVAASSARYDLQRNTAVNFATYNGMTAADTVLVQWVDSTGTPFANDAFNRPMVGAGTVQGMKISITASRGTVLFQALGIPSIAVSVSAMAQFGTPNGLIGPIPLVLNCDSVPRTPAGCPPSTGGPVTLYQPVLMTVQSGAVGPAACCTPGQLDSLGRPIPATFYALGGQNFFIIHDKPTDMSATALANRTSTHIGLTTTITLGVTYYAEIGAPQTTNFALGLQDRIQDSLANPVFGGDRGTCQGCFSPLNPRVFIVGINRTSGAGACACPAGVGSLIIDEFLAFYVEFITFDPVTPANGLTIGGYYVLSTGVPGANGFGSPTAPGPKIFRLTQ